MVYNGKDSRAVKGMLKLKSILDTLETVDYSKAVYVNTDTAIELRCKVHDLIHYTRPANILTRGTSGCEVCRYNSSSKTQIKNTYAKELKSINSDRKPIESYKGYKIRIKHKCLDCGAVSKLEPRKLLLGQKCKCKVTVDWSEPAILYIFKIKRYGKVAYKVGITNKTVQKRYTDEDYTYFSEIESYSFSTRREAFLVEQSLLLLYDKFRYVGRPLLKNGNTELFKIRPKLKEINMGGSRAKQKGSSFEREVAKVLNVIFEMEDAFGRSSGSGSKFGGKNSIKLNKHNRHSSKNALGDLSTPDGIDLIVECKSYASLAFHQLIQGDCPQVNKWLDQLNSDIDTFYSVFEETLPKMLVFKINRAGTYYMIPKEQILKGFLHSGTREVTNRIEYKYAGTTYFIVSENVLLYEEIANAFIASSRVS